MRLTGAVGTSGGSEEGSFSHSIWRRTTDHAAEGSAWAELLAAESFRENLPAWARSEWDSLRRERDSEVLGESLVALGGRLVRGGREDAALEIFSAVGERAAAPLRERALGERDAILGRGLISRRVEFLGSRLAREASEPTSLIGMVAGSAVFNLGRTALLSRLLGSGTTSLFTRGFGARLAAGTGAFFLEVPAFWGSSKLLREAVHPGSQAWGMSTNLRELLGAGLTLGALKLTGWGASAVAERVFSRALAPSALPSLLQGAVHQSGMLAGILLGHRLETFFSLRPHLSDATTFVDSLAMLLQFNIAGRLTRGVGGEGLGRLSRELDLRAAQRGDRGGRFPFGPAWAMAGSGGRGEISESRTIGERFQRPLLMAVDPTRGGGGKTASSMGSFLERALRDSRTEDLRRLKNLVFEIYTERMKKRPTENLRRYHESQDPEGWRDLVRIITALSESHEDMSRVFAADAELRAFREEWESRPHFTSADQVTVKMERFAEFSNQYQKAIEELRRAIHLDPSLRGWHEFAVRQGAIAKKEPKKSFAMTGVDTPSGRSFLGNWRNWGMRVDFDQRGHFVEPIRIMPRFAADELTSALERLRNPQPEPAPESPPPPLPPSPPPAIDPFLPVAGEEPGPYALRLMSEGGKGNERALAAARGLSELLRDPARRAFGVAAVERMTGYSRNLESKSTIVAKSYTIPGLAQPLTVVSVPSLFLPDSWSEVFAEGIVLDHGATRARVPRAVEIGSGTGLVSILMDRLGMAEEIIGLDVNSDSTVIGELNALLNGATHVTFRESSLLSGLSPNEKVDLVVACIPQVPMEGDVADLRARADYYPQRNTYMDRFGLGLVDDAIGQSRERLTENGRILFNLGGRPGRATLEEMFVRWGFHPTLRNGRMVPQDPKTDIKPLAQMELATGHRYEFYLNDPGVSLSAQDALGKTGLRHWLYLLEGRAYAGLLRAELPGALEAGRWGYSEDPGSENEALRAALARDLSRQWGTTLAPETIFVAPHAESFLTNWLKAAVPPRGRVLLAGNAAERMKPLLENANGYEVATVAADLGSVADSMREAPPAALILEQPGTHGETTEEIARLFQAATRHGTQVVFVETYPRRNAGEPNLWTEYLSTDLAALENTVLLQPLSERWDAPELPLAAAVVANPVLYERLAHEAEVSYSRVSSPIQEIYLRSFRALEEGMTAEETRSGSIHPLMTQATQGFPRIKILDADPTFRAAPRATHEDPIDMSFGESELSLDVDFRAAAREALTMRYSHLYAKAQESVRDYLAQSRGVDYRPEQIVLGPGVQDLLGRSLAALRRLHPGRPLDVLVPRPSYGLYFPTVELAGGRLKEVVTVAERGFLADAAALSPFAGNGRSAPAPQRAFLVNQPTNPAGRYYSDAEWRTLFDWLKPDESYLLLDDVFGMLRLPSRGPARDHQYWNQARDRMRNRLIGFGGLSKEFAAGGVRFGFAAGDNPDLLQAMTAGGRPDALALAAALETLPRWHAHVETHKRYLSHRMLQLTGLLREKNIPFVEPEGGYSLFVDLRSLFGREFRATGRPRVTVDASNFHETLMSEAGLKIHSDSWARVHGWYRFVYSIDRIDEAVSRLRKFFRNLRG